jgi:hypothetical protein
MQFQNVLHRTALAKQAFWAHKEYLRRNINIPLKKKLLKSLVWPVLLYGCETWTYSKEIENKLNAADIWFYRRILKVSWTDKVKNEDIWRRVGSNFSLLATAQKRKLAYVGHVLRGSAGENILNTLEGYTKKYTKRGRPRTNWIDNVKKWLQTRSYQAMKKKALTRDVWRRMVADLRIEESTR